MLPAANTPRGKVMLKSSRCHVQSEVPERCCTLVEHPFRIPDVASLINCTKYFFRMKKRNVTGKYPCWRPTCTSSCKGNKRCFAPRSQTTVPHLRWSSSICKHWTKCETPALSTSLFKPRSQPTPSWQYYAFRMLTNEHESACPRTYDITSNQS